MRAGWQQNECIAFLTEFKKKRGPWMKSCSNGLWLISAGGCLLIICSFWFITVSGCVADAPVLFFCPGSYKKKPSTTWKQESDAVIISIIQWGADDGQINVTAIFLWSGFSYKMRSPLRKMTDLVPPCHVAPLWISVRPSRRHRNLLQAQQRTGLAGQRVVK